MFGVGMPELVIVLVIMLFFFGPTKLPQLGSSLGADIKGFRKAAGHDPVDHKEEHK